MKFNTDLNSYNKDVKLSTIITCKYISMFVLWNAFTEIMSLELSAQRGIIRSHSSSYSKRGKNCGVMTTSP